MADPPPPPEAVSAGSGLMINNDELPSASGPDSGDRVGSNDPSYNRGGKHILLEASNL